MEAILSTYIHTGVIILILVAIMRLLGGWIFRTNQIIDLQKAQLRQLHKQNELQRRLIRFLKEEKEK